MGDRENVDKEVELQSEFVSNFQQSNQESDVPDLFLGQSQELNHPSATILLDQSNFQQSNQESDVPDLFPGQSQDLNHPSATILLDQAQEASVMCKVAAEALNDASQAAANMLDGLLQQFCSMYRIVDDPEVANNDLGTEVSQNSQNLLARIIQEAHTKATRDGSVLQWCSISTVDFRSCLIECKIELGEFLDDEEVARCVGISIDEPLIIRIFAESKEVRIRQDGHDGHSIATAFLLPNIVKEDLLQYVETAPYTAFVDDENLFIRLLQHIAQYLRDLESICLVCRNRHHLQGRIPKACTRTLCQATLESWAGIAPLGMTEVLVPAQVSMLPAAPRRGSNSVSA